MIQSAMQLVMQSFVAVGDAVSNAASWCSRYAPATQVGTITVNDNAPVASAASKSSMCSTTLDMNSAAPEPSEELSSIADSSLV